MATRFIQLRRLHAVYHRRPLAHQDRAQARDFTSDAKSDNEPPRRCHRSLAIEICGESQPRLAVPELLAAEEVQQEVTGLLRALVQVQN